MTSLKRLAATFLAPAAAISGSAAWAQVDVEGLETIGKPLPAGTGFQPAATELARELQALDHGLLITISLITLFVLALLVICIVRYNQKANPTPARFTHNTPVEVAWTIVPVLILIGIGAFSLPVLFHQQEIPEGDITIKATGYQWYWGYEYVDAGSDAVEPGAIAFDQFMLAEDELEAAGFSPDEYLLATTQPIVIPTGKDIVFQVTGADVIHSWTIPAFGVKQDGIPGRLAELWFNVEPGMEGTYFGQCSELCGKDHAYMPITVRAVTQEQYEEWLGRANEEYAGVPNPNTITVAAAE